MFQPNRREPSSRPTSVLVYGTDPTATSTLAVGLALRGQRSFSWADCARPEATTKSAPTGPVSRGRSRDSGEAVSSHDLSLPHWSGAAIEGLLLPESRVDSLQLMSYLALPGLLQQLAALSVSSSGESSIVLTNIDKLDRDLRSSVFGRPDLHRRLRESKISLFVTSGERPSEGELESFEVVFRIQVPPGGVWSAAEVHSVKGTTGSPVRRAASMRSTWQAYGLDPTLLPPP